MTRENVLVVEITDSRVPGTSNPADARADARTRARPRRKRLLHPFDRSRASIANGGTRERNSNSRDWGRVGGISRRLVRVDEAPGVRTTSIARGRGCSSIGAVRG